MIIEESIDERKDFRKIIVLLIIACLVIFVSDQTLPKVSAAWSEFTLFCEFLWVFFFFCHGCCAKSCGEQRR